MITFFRNLALSFVLVAVAACQSNQQPQLVLSQKSATEVRAMQSRVFDTTNYDKTLRTVIATFQDLGYIIDKVEAESRTVTATKLVQLRMTATVYPRGATQTVVRANAVVQQPTINTQVDDPAFYQQYFFDPLSNALFLTALQVDDIPDPPTPPSDTATSDTKDTAKKPE